MSVYADIVRLHNRIFKKRHGIYFSPLINILYLGAQYNVHTYSISIVHIVDIHITFSVFC